MPGPIPAMNISPTEAPVTTLYMIMVTLGGISAAKLAEETISPSTSAWGYPDSSIWGRSVFPMATTVACVEPEMAPKKQATTTQTMAMPPRR